MKKVMVAVMLMGIMSTGAMALVSGTVSKIWVKSDKTIIYVGTKACSLGTDDRSKAYLSVFLTAQASGKTVDVNMAGGVCQAVFLHD